MIIIEDAYMVTKQGEGGEGGQEEEKEGFLHSACCTGCTKQSQTGLFNNTGKYYKKNNML